MKWLWAGASLVGALACGPSCVARGTLVRTPRGLRRIEEVLEEDEVYCVDPEAGRLLAGTVSATRSAERECVLLGFGKSELIATSDHPIYCPDTKEWAPAGDWAQGKRLRLLRVESESMAPVKIDRVSIFAGVHQVFDLTMDHPLHNFIANGVLVHNKSVMRACTLPSAERSVVNGDPCACSSGASGEIECLESGGIATCVRCADAGTNDGGQ